MRKQAQDKAPQWHTGNLIPTEDVVGEESVQYHEKVICWDVAGGRSEEYTRLYQLVPASEVMEMWAIKRAYEW